MHSPTSFVRKRLVEQFGQACLDRAEFRELLRLLEEDFAATRTARRRCCEETLHNALSAFPDVHSLWLSAGGTIAGHTPGAAFALCGRVRTLVGKKLVDMASHEAAPVLKDALERGGRYRRAAHGRFIHMAEGESRWFEVSFIPAAEGVYSLLLLRDVTHIAKSDERIREILGQMESRIEQRTAELAAANDRLLKEIGERTRVDAALRESEVRFRTIADSAGDGVVMVDHTGAVEFWNRAAATLFGVSPDKAVGKSFIDLVAPPGREADYRSMFSPLQASGGESEDFGRTFELTARRPSGSVLSVELTFAVFGLGGSRHGVVVVRDVTSRKRFEEALKRAKDAAEEAGRLKTDFLSMVSHELRTPLTSILGFSKMIKKRLVETLKPALDLSKPKAGRAFNQVGANIDIIVSEGERLTELINNVLDLSKLESGKFVWRMERISVEELMHRSVAATEILFAGKGLSLAVEIEPDLPHIEGDFGRLTQVVINLLSNAAKFTETGGVVCRAYRSQREIHIEVIDSGIGISPLYLNDVFDKFKQLGDTLTDRPRGSGLGLPISREIVEHHGGKIWVNSAPGQGSRFTIALKAA